METGTKKILLILGIIAADVAFNFGLSYAGIPSAIDFMPLVGTGLLAILGVAFGIVAVASISQGKLQEAGLSKLGEAAKAEQSIKLRRRFRKGYLTRLRNKAYGKIDGYLAKIERISRWNAPEGYQLKSFEDNRVLVFAIMDYALRLDIFISKWFTLQSEVTSTKETIGQKINRLNGELGERNKIPKLELRSEIRDLRSGSINGNEKYGWAQFDKELIDAINRVTELMFEALKSGSKSRDIAGELRRLLNNLGRKSDYVATSYGKFNSRVAMYGTHHEIHSVILNAYDMYNPHAEYGHHYIVTKPNAKFRRISNIYDPGNIENAPAGMEVDVFGIEVDVANAAKVEKKGLKPKKLLNPREMSQFIHHVGMVNYLQVEWRAILENLREGRFAAKTRRIPDYAEAFKPNSKKDVHLNDDSVILTGKGGTAFDRRALPNPGNIPFKGRKNFSIENWNEAVLDDTYPMLTIAGMQDYMRLLIEAREHEYNAKIDEYLTKLPDDYEGWPKSEADLNKVLDYARKSGESKKTKNG